MTPPRLIVFSDLSVAPEARLLERLTRTARAASPGSVLLVLRDKDRSARERLALGRKIAALARGAGQPFGVAETLDLALLLEADALHLGEGSVEPSDARRLMGDACFVTRAVHAIGAPPALCDGVVLSPVVAGRKGKPPLGLDALPRARQELPAKTALYALGGVDAASAARCLSAGATGVAAIGAVLGVEDPLPLLDALGIARH